MTTHSLDEFSAEHLLSGKAEPEDAPAGYTEVARLLQAAAAPATGSELRNERNAVDAAVMLLRDQVTEATRRAEWSGVAGPSRRSKLFKAKVTGLLVAATLVGSTGLAFAGALPPGLQHVASSILSYVGASVPDGTKGATISQIATTTTATGVAKGAQISTAASNGHSQAGQHGSASSGSHGQSSSQSQAGQNSQAGQHPQGGKPSGTPTGSPPTPNGGNAGPAPAGGGGSSSGSGHGGNGP